jgi:hypothetical protein
MITTPYLEIPTDNVIPAESDYSENNGFSNYIYKNGDKLTIEYNFDEDYEHQLSPTHGNNEAITKVNDQFQDYFKSRDVVYFESESPRKLTTNLH